MTAPLAVRVLDALRAVPSGLSRQDLHRALGNNASADELTAVLEDLAAQGVVRSQRTQPARGRPAEMWRITSSENSHSISQKSADGARETTPRDTLQEMADRWFASQRQRLGLEVRR